MGTPIPKFAFEIEFYILHCSEVNDILQI